MLGTGSIANRADSMTSHCSWTGRTGYAVPMTPEQARFLLDFTLPSLRQETATTTKILAATPNANLDYRPSERCMPAAELLWHIRSEEHTSELQSHVNIVCRL